ncbi:hypothetical protein [Nonomuraea sp. NPDC005650]|uniref:hypothetical protein n=1 Tax=Nonomuraea sp. NPDC005650 TaxID=3157045 RepID=UPI0033B8B4C6
MTTLGEAPQIGRLRVILAKLHGRTAAGVPRWAVWAAYATTLIPLPSGIWRIAALIFGAPLLEFGSAPPPGHGPMLIDGRWWYIVALSVVSEAAALLTVGLVAQWGEVWPRRIPGLGGRRVPILAAVVPAGLGAAVLLVFPFALVMLASGRMINGNPSGLIVHGWQAVVFWVTYAPLAAWGPLLGLLTVHYFNRRRTTRSGGGDSGETEAARSDTSDSRETRATRAG